MSDLLDSLQIRIHGDAGRPTLIYLPGIHGDWTLVTSFRSRVKEQVRFVEFSYPRSIACRTCLPVYALVGGLDPVVPALPVRRWLRRHCPGYRGAKTILRADHNVLGTAPRLSAEQICQWLKADAVALENLADR